MASPERLLAGGSPKGAEAAPAGARRGRRDSARGLAGLATLAGPLPDARSLDHSRGSNAHRTEGRPLQLDHTPSTYIEQL